MGTPYIGPGPSAATDVATKGYADSVGGGGGGGLTTTEIEIDFGSKTCRSKRFTITDAASSTSSKIHAWQSGNPATGRGKDDALWDTITYSVRPLNGSFILQAFSSGRIQGKRKVFYTIST